MAKKSLAAREKEARERLVEAATSRGLINSRDVAVAARDGQSARRELSRAQAREAQRQAKLRKELGQLTQLLAEELPETVRADLETRAGETRAQLERDVDLVGRVRGARDRRRERAEVTLSAEAVTTRLEALDARLERAVSASACRRVRKQRARLVGAIGAINS